MGGTIIHFEELLAKEGKLVYKTRGVSMEPMLRQDRDIVVIKAATAPLSTMDVAFYRRGDQYVLHRVISCQDDSYLIRGDNTYVVEKVSRDAVLGVLVSFQRKGKTVSTGNMVYKLYARVWNAIYPLRFLYVKTKRLAMRILRHLKQLGREKGR